MNWIYWTWKSTVCTEYRLLNIINILHLLIILNILNIQHVLIMCLLNIQNYLHLLNKLNILHVLNTLNTLNILHVLNTFYKMNALFVLNSMNTLHTLFVLNTLSKLNVLKQQSYGVSWLSGPVCDINTDRSSHLWRWWTPSAREIAAYSCSIPSWTPGITASRLIHNQRGTEGLHSI